MLVTLEDFKKSLAITKFSFATVGVIIYKRNEKVSQIKWYLGHITYRLCFLILSVAVFGELTYMFKSLSLNFLGVTNVAPCICYCVIGLVKLSAVHSHLDKSEKLLNKLETLWPTEELNESQMRIVNKYLAKGTTGKYLVTVTNILFIWTFNLSSIIVLLYNYIATGSIVKTVPYFIYTPFDITGTFVYPFVYLYHIIAGHIANIGTIGPDNFFVATTFHICMQFRLLSWKLKHLVEQTAPPECHQNIDINHHHHQDMYDNLVKCIKLHSELIELTGTLEEIFTLSILVNFLGSSILICCVGFQSTAVTGMELVIFVLFLIEGLIQTFVLCWAGNQLIETSNGIADAAYNSSWYLADKKYRQLILFIILRAQRPQMLTAMRFSVVSLRSFSSILSSAWSYFTLLQTTYRKK